MASKYHDDWQSSKTTVLQRNAYMFDNPLMSDIAFTCGESSRVFHAHKYVVATSSAVFYAMFYGDLAQDQPTICILDADDESFEEFLRFLYTDDCNITVENTIRVMYLAKKYLIFPLVEKCREVLQASITPDNVFMVLERAVQFDEDELQGKCWDMISTRTLECVSSEEFCNIGSDTLNALLKTKRDTLKITEIELFNTGVLKWVDSECARQGINIEEDNTARRRVLGDSVYEIRFLEMSQQDFAKYVSPTGILTGTEIISMFQKFNGLDVAGLKWKDQEKRRCRIFKFSRFDHAQISMRWNYIGGKYDGLVFTANKPVVFHGVRLFGNSSGSQYQVTFATKRVHSTRTYTSEQDDEGVWGYDVMLSKPITLLPNTKFVVIARITGLPSQRGCNGKSSVKIDDIVVTFEDAPRISAGRSNGTNKTDGQFYKIFLSRAD